MSVRTIKGAAFTIVVDGKRIVVKHVYGKGKRCRVMIPPGVVIEEYREATGRRDDPLLRGEGTGTSG